MAVSNSGCVEKCINGSRNFKQEQQNQVDWVATSGILAVDISSTHNHTSRSRMHVFKVLILGIGNPLRSDDGVGWWLASELLHEMRRDDVRVIATQQLMPEISEMASHAERVLFIDATASGEPGTLEFKQITPGCLSRHSHELSPAGVLKLAQDLYGRSPTAFLLTIAGESFGTGDSLSAKVAAALPRAKTEVAHFIEGTREVEGT